MQSNPNFNGMQMLISHDGNNKIIHHAATITSETKKMGGLNLVIWQEIG